ncbi:uncharacterized protein IWZ02DRAFT_432454 [Phyllosticta citriasiana]|uniref:uncharacterized protein n=1 Tax=Phyllosticta citriasiana TaxID=595635 RepID=UPI0030FD4DAA
MTASISVLVFLLSTISPRSNIHHPFLLYSQTSCQATAKIPSIRRLSRPLPSPFLIMPFETSSPRPSRIPPQVKSRVSANTGPRSSQQSPESESTHDPNDAAESVNDPATPNTPLAAAAGSPDADASPITPAPLNILPSRARRQFAARLAERKRAAAEHGTGDLASGAAGEGDDDQQFGESMGGEGDGERERERDWTERYGGDAAATDASTTASGKLSAAASSSAAAGGAARFSNLFKHSAEDSEEEEESSSDEEGEELVMKEGVLARKRSGVGSSAGSTSSAGSGGGGSDKERE